MIHNLKFCILGVQCLAPRRTIELHADEVSRRVARVTGDVPRIAGMTDGACVLSARPRAATVDHKPSPATRARTPSAHARVAGLDSHTTTLADDSLQRAHPPSLISATRGTFTTIGATSRGECGAASNC